jgi:hypothetical protein
MTRRRWYKVIGIVLLQGSVLLTQSASNVAATGTVTYHSEQKSTVYAENATVIAQQKKAVPARVNLPVEFFAQAPTGDWREPYQNACEEMSALLVDAYLSNATSTVNEIEDKVVQLTRFVQQKGYNTSISIFTVQLIVSEYFNRQSTIIENPSIEDIEQSINAGYPVIVPLAGQLLQNPYFMGDGPLYHMLIISGYTESTFITQEVGTTYGSNYEYSKHTVLQAIHDLEGSPEEILHGRSRVLIVH